MNDGRMTFSLRYASLEQGSVACRACGGVLATRLPPIWVYGHVASDEGAARPICASCAKQLCPHLFRLLGGFPIARSLVQKKGKITDEWSPVSEWAVPVEVIEIEPADTPVATPPGAAGAKK